MYPAILFVSPSDLVMHMGHELGLRRARMEKGDVKDAEEKKEEGVRCP